MNERGYVLIVLLSLLPILLLATSMTAWLVWFGYQQQSAEKICFTHILKAQQALVNSSLEVIALNPKAYQLIGEKRMWQTVAKTAPPPAKALAIANIQRLRSQQFVLKARQQALLTHGLTTANLDLKNLQNELTKKLNKMGGEWSTQKSYSWVQVHGVGPQIKPIIQEIAPPYRVKHNYRQHQQLMARWRVPLRNDHPNLLTVNETKSIWRGECFSHPTFTGGLWQASLGKAKFL